tara:strand:+ start:4356 stop:5159 length:804 start_codon:yes stop_codon:yes gene_type:complete
MAFHVDDLVIGGQMKDGSGICPATGEGPTKINGSTMIEGPVVMGNPTTYPFPYGCLNIAPLTNSDVIIPPFVPGALIRGLSNPYSLAVVGDAAIFDNLDVALRVQSGNEIVAQGHVVSYAPGVGGPPHYLAAKKNFDIPHPTREGWRLRHTCPEGPSNDVYVRGRVTNKNEIILPTYWKELVDWTTITVNLTSIGAHQNVIVKRIDEEKVYLQAHGGMPINCFYHIYGTRSDGERLIPEYKGETPADYPGNNDEYSVSGYHYDKREV